MGFPRARRELPLWRAATRATWESGRRPPYPLVTSMNFASALAHASRSCGS